MKLKYFALAVLLIGSSSAFAQLTVGDDSNDRTNGLYDGVSELTYNFQVETNYSLTKSNEEIIAKGHGKKVLMGVLVPGEYFMEYAREDGRMVRDRFVILKK